MWTPQLILKDDVFLLEVMTEVNKLPDLAGEGHVLWRSEWLA